MEAISHELALRYLLELSTDIRVALLIDKEGKLVASAPEPPSEQIARRSEELVREATALASADEAVEVDVSVDGGTVYVVREDEPALVCVAGPFALPGLILHDMRVVLGDLKRGEAGPSK
jgi:predicted regulator of Ras-like GTPase activity (Roadblock/LC7/MglB family)